MEELYLETKKGNLPIEQNIIEKYDLNSGTLSPFTQQRIVDVNGEYQREPSYTEDELNKEFNDMQIKGMKSDGIDQMENGFELSTSEIIDFSQGTDSGD